MDPMVVAADGAGTAAPPTEWADATGIQRLCTDTLIAVMSHLDAHSLARAACTCKLSRDIARTDHLWADLTRARWHLRERKTGKYKYGERSWREVFRVFNRRMRPPTISGISPREVAYASGRSGRVACWLFVTHLPACRLVQRHTHTVLTARCVIQNLRDSPVVVDLDPAASLALVLRDGQISHPASPLPDEQGPHGTRTLAPLEVVMLADVAFPVPSHMSFEPDVLEACHRLRLRVAAHVCAARSGFSLPLEVSCKFVEEATIWRNYESINASFLVHHDPE
jgi:hypothetical protein